MVIACLGVRFTKISLRWQTRNKKNNFAETLFRSLYASQPVVRVKNGMALPGSCFWARVHRSFSWFLIAKLTLSAKLRRQSNKNGSSDCRIWEPQWDVELALSEAVNFISLRSFLKPQWGFEFNSLRSCFSTSVRLNLCDTFVSFDIDVKNSLHVPLPHWGGISPHMVCFPKPDFFKSEFWFFKIRGWIS